MKKIANFLFLSAHQIIILIAPTCFYFRYFWHQFYCQIRITFKYSRLNYHAQPLKINVSTKSLRSWTNHDTWYSRQEIVDKYKIVFGADLMPNRFTQSLKVRESKQSDDGWKNIKSKMVVDCLETPIKEQQQHSSDVDDCVDDFTTFFFFPIFVIKLCKKKIIFGWFHEICSWPKNHETKIRIRNYRCYRHYFFLARAFVNSSHTPNVRERNSHK